jgi:hypothetical protein
MPDDMDRQLSSYYAEILILVDGWPWNLSEFDFRRFFAPGSCPPALLAVAVASAPRTTTPPSRVSENRRVRDGKNTRRKNAKSSRARVEALANALREKVA